MDMTSGDHSMPMTNASSSPSKLMSMASMQMTFFTSHTTPLYGPAWSPHSAAQYIGTCIFLIALAAFFRTLLALRSTFDDRWATRAFRRHTALLLSKGIGREGDTTGGTRRRPWEVNEAVARALLDTLVMGVSYLLMLAVMTMNVGYFLSVLGGTFVGSLLVGGDGKPTVSHCDAH